MDTEENLHVDTSVKEEIEKKKIIVIWIHEMYEQGKITPKSMGMEATSVKVDKKTRQGFESTN